MCPLYLEDIESILLRIIQVRHQLQNLMIRIWINSKITLHGQFIFLENHEYYIYHYIIFLYYIMTLHGHIYFERVSTMR